MCIMCFSPGGWKGYLCDCCMIVSESIKKRFMSCGWRALGTSILAVAFSLLLVHACEDRTASILVGADDFDVRSQYYNAIVDYCRGPQCDSVIIYDPFYNTIVTDTRRQLADELRFVAQFKPKIIIFDHIHPISSHTASDSLLIDAIGACLDSNIVFVVPESYSSGANVNKNFFHDQPFSTSLVSGSPYIPINRIGESGLIDFEQGGKTLPWIPELVYSLLKIGNHSGDYYVNKYLSFESSERIPYYHRGFFSKPESGPELVRLIQSNIVIFSAYSLGDDMHIMPFYIRGVSETEEGLKKLEVGGAELMWYAIRDELCDYYDKRLPLPWVVLISIMVSFLYSFHLLKSKRIIFVLLSKLIAFLYSIHLLKCKRRINIHPAFSRFFDFLFFAFISLIVLSIIGGILMYYHWVLPMAIPAISIVLCNILIIDWDEKY